MPSWRECPKVSSVWPRLSRGSSRPLCGRRAIDSFMNRPQCLRAVTLELNSERVCRGSSRQLSALRDVHTCAISGSSKRRMQPDERVWENLVRCAFESSGGSDVFSSREGTDERALCVFEDGIPRGVSVGIRYKTDFRERGSRKPEAQRHSTLARRKGAHLWFGVGCCSHEGRKRG